jgi:hypothetical protein
MMNEYLEDILSATVQAKEIIESTPLGGDDYDQWWRLSWGRPGELERESPCLVLCTKSHEKGAAVAKEYYPL